MLNPKISKLTMASVAILATSGIALTAHADDVLTLNAVNDQRETTQLKTANDNVDRTEKVIAEETVVQTPDSSEKQIDKAELPKNSDVIPDDIASPVTQMTNSSVEESSDMQKPTAPEMIIPEGEISARSITADDNRDLGYYKQAAQSILTAYQRGGNQYIFGLYSPYEQYALRRAFEIMTDKKDNHYSLVMDKIPGTLASSEQYPTLLSLAQLVVDWEPTTVTGQLTPKPIIHRVGPGMASNNESNHATDTSGEDMTNSAESQRVETSPTRTPVHFISKTSHDGHQSTLGTYSRSQRSGNLPKTGEQNRGMLNILGLGILIGLFNVKVFRKVEK